MPLDITAYPAGAHLDVDENLVPVEIEDADFLSFINSGTYGKPAIVAPGEDHQAGDIKVVYVNTSLVAVCEVDKRA